MRQPAEALSLECLGVRPHPSIGPRHPDLRIVGRYGLLKCSPSPRRPFGRERLLRWHVARIHVDCQGTERESLEDRRDGGQRASILATSSLVLVSFRERSQGGLVGVWTGAHLSELACVRSFHSSSPFSEPQDAGTILKRLRMLHPRRKKRSRKRLPEEIDGDSPTFALLLLL